MKTHAFQVKYEKVLTHAGGGISLNFMHFLIIHRNDEIHENSVNSQKLGEFLTF